MNRFLSLPTLWILCLTLLAFSGCFGGVRRTGKVVGYREGKVLTKKGFYRVGQLPPEWKRIKLEKALVAFYNSDLKSTIATDSFCDQAYNDSSLKNLTRHLFPGLQETKIIEEQPFMLDGREALQTVLSANMDGVPVMLNLVVVKKDWCLFDFYLVGEKEHFAPASQAFENFFGGFVFEGGS